MLVKTEVNKCKSESLIINQTLTCETKCHCQQAISHMFFFASSKL
jgi:hypothetical protein